MEDITMKLINPSGRQKSAAPTAEPAKADSVRKADGAQPDGAQPDGVQTESGQAAKQTGQQPDGVMDREERIRQSAYQRAADRGFDGDPLEHWLAAESEIDAGQGNEPLSGRAGAASPSASNDGVGQASHRQP
jgi:hypothetical protein